MRRKLGNFRPPIPYNRGSMLLSALFLIALVTLTGLSLLAMTSSESLISIRQVRSAQLEYLCQSGLEWARAVLGSDPESLSSGTAYRLDSLPGKVNVTIMKPVHNGFISVKSSAALPDGSTRQLEYRLSAPPVYVIFCRALSINLCRNITGRTALFGLPAHPDFVEPEGITGTVRLAPGDEVACQTVSGSKGAQPGLRTQRYQALPPDMDYFRSLNRFSRDINWEGYDFEFAGGNKVLPPQAERQVVVSEGGIIVYSDHEPIKLESCYLIAQGDIWVISLGEGPSRISGSLWAGGTIHLYQRHGDMAFAGSLCAADTVELCPVEGEIYLQHDPALINGAPSWLKNHLGFLGIESVQPVFG